MITLKNISKSFGGLQAVRNVSIEIKKGTITGLIGPNGAGKTTLFNIIAGFYKADSGSITLDSQDISGLRSDELFEKGLLSTFQIAHEFEKLTVRENLMMVPSRQSGENIVNTWLFSKKIRDEEQINYERASEVMDFLGLDHLQNEKAGRTMMVDPKIVLLDEVGAGVNKTLLKKISKSIARLNAERGYTFFMIEHDIDFISELCDPIIVMTEGSVLTTGSAEKIKNNEQVIEAYLGV